MLIRRKFDEYDYNRVVISRPTDIHSSLFTFPLTPYFSLVVVTLYCLHTINFYFDLFSFRKTNLFLSKIHFFLEHF